jgi:hypothetical protein
MDLSDFPSSLDDLIDYTKRQHPDGDALQHLSDAMLASEHVNELADHLIGHFVDQARRAGASWTDIGRAMGVSKQAAQKRFVPPSDFDLTDLGGGAYDRFTDRARRVVKTAHAVARAGQHQEIGSIHLVLGLVAESKGLAARAINAQGVSTEQLQGAAKASLGPASDEPLPDHLPFGSDCKKILQLTLREALRLGHNYIGTEHILLGVLRDEKSAGARTLTSFGVEREPTEKWLLAALEGYRHGRAAGA